MESETLEQMQARHRKEQRDLVGRITSKKKNATKKTRKGVNDECAEMERSLKEKQEEEIAALTGGGTADVAPEDEEAPAADRDEAGEVADKLEKTAISEPTPAQAQAQAQAQEQEQPTQGQGQGQGKKRNRQKERMARRAAEQEAAAIKAEEEAKNMTDHRGVEKTYMLKEFKTHSLTEKEIAPDGHCLFSAVADQLQQRGIPLAPDAEPKVLPYKIVRKRAADWMAEHPDDFAPFLEEDLEGYVGRIRDTAEWGGQLELVALASIYGVEIRVVQDGRTEKIGSAEEEDKKIWLAYYRHGYGLGEHYNSLRKTT
ncbi:OTU domain-containing protein [Colletotrichum truncatum]|uniref:OTU domain-containing protein n=1 Tax=Colletotrichum truncatum TaxID=5467 RepID=A0ACC3ZE96_COLTU|nr:OTU domain-containing protein [Colletotrichum truncatum]KAF6794821.1 OTU domain-containing protein [Colletotrichum truncatum]